ncbi:MAG TPA: GYD domain-containing protein [Hyphomicrobiaceae bacterium]|nr:GYD domain-containing protein [Hyphomicrobiaceae bacterium]
MAHYIMLASYTEQGIRTIQDTIKRADAVKEMAKKAGLEMKQTFWTLGQYDVVAVFEAPNDEAMTAFALSVAKLGNVKTQTLRAFSPSDMQAILQKVK